MHRHPSIAQAKHAPGRRARRRRQSGIGATLFACAGATALLAWSPPRVSAQKPAIDLPQGSRSDCGFTVFDYNWDFSLGGHGFTGTDCDNQPSPGIWEYGPTSYIPGAPGNVWGTVLSADYPNSSGGGLLSPSFLVTESSRYVEILHYYSSEAGYDGGNVSVGTWPGSTIIDPIGGYPSPQINGSASYYALCVDGERGWTGNDATWRTDCFDLAPYVGQWISLQFDFGADETVTAPGWYLARVRVGGVNPTLGACCYQAGGAMCVYTDPTTCEAYFGGQWTPGFDCADANGNGVADVCEASAVADDGNTPVTHTRLLLCQPNPFRERTAIRFDLARVGSVSLEIFDVAGRCVRSLLEERETAAGRHEILWDGRSAVSEPPEAGVYFVRLRVRGETFSRPIILAR